MAESRAAATAEETVQLRAELEAARSAPQQRQQSAELPAAHAIANGHVENGAVSAEEQVNTWLDHELCSSDHLQHRYHGRSPAFPWQCFGMVDGGPPFHLHMHDPAGGMLHNRQGTE